MRAWLVVLMASVVQGQAFVQVETIPNIVQSEDATLTVGFALSKPLVKESWIRIIFPDEMKVSPSVEKCEETQNFFKITECKANVASNWIEMKLDTDLVPQGTITAVYNVRMLKAVSTTMTIKVSNPIKLETQNNEVQQTVFGATIGTIDKVDLKPVSDVVGDDTSLKVSFTTKHKIPRRGKIVLQANEIWNLGAIEKQKEYFNSITCDSFTVQSQNKTGKNDMINFSCNLMLNPTRVVVENAFEEADLPANSQVTFVIHGFKNPIQSKDKFQVFELYTTGFEIADRVDILRNAFVQVNTPAKLLDASIQPHAEVSANISNMVQEINTLELKFNSPIPFRKGCRISYQFPKAFFNVSDITELRTGALFSLNPETLTPTDFQIKEEKDNYQSINFQSCPIFRKQGVPETTKLTGMFIPLTTEQTLSIKIYITDAEGELIIYEDKGIQLTPFSGKIDLLSTTFTPTTVSALSYFTFKLRPQHHIYLNEQPKIKIMLPDEFVVQPSCDRPATGCQTSLFDNSITVSEFLSENLEGGKEFEFSVGPLRLYHSTKVVQEQFTFTLLYRGRADLKNNFVVDTGVGTPILEMTSGDAKLDMTLDTYQSFMKSALTVKIVTEHPVPQYGNIILTYPEQVQFEDPNFSQSQCKDWKNFASNSGVCQIFAKNRTIIISKGFMQAASKTGQVEVSFTVPQMTNPPTLDPTGTFYLRTTDQFFNTVDETKKEVKLTMKKPAEFKQAKVKSSSPMNSVAANYTFELVTATNIFPKEYATITFPVELKMPDKLECILNSNANKNKTVPCVKSDKTPNQLVIELADCEIIKPKETFTIQVGQIINAISTEETKEIKIVFYDSKELVVPTNSDAGGLTVQNSVPFQLNELQATFERDSDLPGKKAVYTLKMKIQHDIQAGGGVLIRYPPQVNVPEEKLKVSVDATDFFDKEEKDKLKDDVVLTEPEIDTSARQIMFLKNFFKKNIKADIKSPKFLTIKIYSFINPMTNEKSSSFEIVTFNQKKNVLYLIDEAQQGMFVENDCNYPCATCQTTNPNFCTACDWNTDLTYLEKGTCLKQCSKGMFSTPKTFANDCRPCDSTCLECELNANRCTSCGIPGYIHLRETECVDQCGPGYIDDPENHMCRKCRDGCSECDKSITNCTKCELQGSTPYFFDFDCLKTCPKDVSVLKNFICERCDPNCKTCSGETNQCTSCQSHQRLDISEKKCVDACRADLEIYDKKTDTCSDCDPSCATCSGSTGFCTSCKEGLVLNLDNTCKPECKGGDPKQFQQVKDLQCQYCESPCRTCEKENLSQCTSCIISDKKEDLRYLYNKTCIDHCPSKFEPNGEEPNQCILVGLICPEGFHINDEGDGCIPNTFECKEGYEINDKNTACIPIPGTPIPFPFIFMGICMSLAVAYSKLKESKNTKVYTSLIMFLGSFELLQYLLMAIWSVGLEQFTAAGLSFLAFFLLLFTNIAFTFMYRRSVLSDSAFKNWIRIYKKTKCLLPVLTALINFKLIRFVISGFYGMENTEAVFKNPQFTIHRPLKFVTYFKYVFVYIPVFIADILIMSNLEWGHQLSVLAIETFIFQVFIIVLTYLEFQNPQLMYQQDEIIYSDIKVKSGVLDDDIHERQLLRLENDCYKYEIILRRKALQGLIKQVIQNFNTANMKAVDMGNEIPKVYTKFDKEQITFKRAFSMVDLQGPTQSSDLTIDGTRSSTSESSQDDIIMKRRYSFPLEVLQEDVADPFFQTQIDGIKRSLLDQKYKDNCYAEAKPPEDAIFKHVSKRKKMVNRRTQTYLRELLMLDGEDPLESDLEILLLEDIEIDDKYTRALIDNVISDGFSQSESDENEGSMPSRLRRGNQRDKGIIAKISKTGKRPDFQLEDIMGQFEIDDSGNYIILRGDDGKLLDKNGRIVNKRGYLIDRVGNIINQRHELIFKRTELDEDGDIPAPVGFDMRKQNLLNLQNQDNIDEMVNTITQEMVPLQKHQLKQSESLNQSQMELTGLQNSNNLSMPSTTKNRIQSSQLPRNQKQSSYNRTSNEFAVPQILDIVDKNEDIGPESMDDLIPENLSQINGQIRDDSLEGAREPFGHIQKPQSTQQWNNFYKNGTNLSANVSQFSHEVELMNDGMLQRPGKGRPTQIMARGENSHLSRAMKRKQTSGTRIKSGDPRLKNLEAIYLKKFGHSNSTLNMKFNKGHSSTVQNRFPPKPVKMNNFRTDEFTVDVGAYRDPKQLDIVDQIDQIEREYLQSHVSRVENFQNNVSQR